MERNDNAIEWVEENMRGYPFIWTRRYTPIWRFNYRTRHWEYALAGSGVWHQWDRPAATTVARATAPTATTVAKATAPTATSPVTKTMPKATAPKAATTRMSTSREPLLLVRPTVAKATAPTATNMGQTEDSDMGQTGNDQTANNTADIEDKSDDSMGQTGNDQTVNNTANTEDTSNGSMGKTRNKGQTGNDDQTVNSTVVKAIRSRRTSKTPPAKIRKIGTDQAKKRHPHGDSD